MATFSSVQGHSRKNSLTSREGSVGTVEAWDDLDLDLPSDGGRRWSLGPTDSMELRPRSCSKELQLDHKEVVTPEALLMEREDLLAQLARSRQLLHEVAEQRRHEEAASAARQALQVVYNKAVDVASPASAPVTCPPGFIQIEASEFARLVADAAVAKSVASGLCRLLERPVEPSALRQWIQAKPDRLSEECDRSDTSGFRSPVFVFSPGQASQAEEPAQPLRFRKITPVWDEESVESGKVLEPLSPQAEMDSELQEPKSKPPEAAELDLKLDPDVQARVDRRHSIWEVRRKRRVLRAWRLLWTASDKEDDLSETADPLMPSAEEFEAFVHGPTDWSDDSGEVKPEKPSPPASPASYMESHEPEETRPQQVSTSTMELGQQPSPSVSPCVSYQVPEEKPKPRVPPITSDKLDSVADAEEEAVNVVRTGTVSRSSLWGLPGPTPRDIAASEAPQRSKSCPPERRARGLRRRLVPLVISTGLATAPNSNIPSPNSVFPTPLLPRERPQSSRTRGSQETRGRDRRSRSVTAATAW
ncbi:unnamed protein product [Effrenium voratum]|nr:unnamed protein product [Effrenium voratum]